MSLIDRELPQRGSTTIENLKASAVSVLSRGFSADRRSVRRRGDKDKSKESETSQDERHLQASKALISSTPETSD
jgi:hypothetical protein